MAVELTEAFLSKIAGWEVVKQARDTLTAARVLSSAWDPPVLKGVVQEGDTTYRAGLVIKDAIDVDNRCTCRESRRWGKICVHSVAVGLHYLRGLKPVTAPPSSTFSTPELPPRGGVAPRSGGRCLRRAGEEGPGEPAEVHVIFPPNACQALEKGRMMVYFEGQWRGGRGPLNSLPPDSPFRWRDLDLRLLDCIELLAGGETPAMLLLREAELVSLLENLEGHPRVTLGKSRGLSIGGEPKGFRIEAKLEATGEICLTWAAKSKHLPLLRGNKTVWVWGEDRVMRTGLAPEWSHLARGPVRVPREEVPRLLSQVWPDLEAGGLLQADFQPEDFSLETEPPRFRLHLKGGLAQLEARLACVYGTRVIDVGKQVEASSWMPDPDRPTHYATRDLEAEQAGLGRLLAYGFRGPEKDGAYQLVGQNQVLNFFARAFPRLERDWDITLEERLERSTTKNLERIEPRFEVTPSGEQWFDLSVVYSGRSGERFSAADIQRLLLSGRSHQRLADGRTVVIDTGAVEELQEVLRDCLPEQMPDRYHIGSAQAGFVEETLRRHAEWRVKAPEDWRKLAAQQRGEAPIEPPELGELGARLRPYQRQGAAWLYFLRQRGFGGILADEMGLGKTVQTLAYLWAVREEHQRAGCRAKPSLIICPTSLVSNWYSEAARFTPDLRCLVLTGGRRQRLFSDIAGCDLLITSYNLLRRDAQHYAEIELDTIILDEAQHIKNRRTQNAQAVKSMRAPHRFVLTGTPMENSVLDLWSIFDFLMPGYLGPAPEFRERYEIPIAREKSAEAQDRLARRLRPFLMRRLKREIAADLPEKLDQVSFCELTAAQGAVYQEILTASRREVLESVGQQGLARSRMVVLNALLRLRQACCDLRLLPLEGVETGEPSGKLELFVELLQEALDGGHRVLVFSQFVRMLGLLKERLGAEGVEFCYLDGSTSNRGEVVARFQNDPRIPVFLISLKAGGVGLNLTGADTVIHFDPWWNPAVEDQATDRAHRIGQTRVVTSYRLITRGTVEEKILSLQSRKREVIRGLLDREDPFTESLSWEEIQELLQ